MLYRGLPGWLSSKESAYDAEDTADIVGSIPGSGRFLGGMSGCQGGYGNPLQCSCFGESRGQKSQAGYSPQSCPVSDMTEATKHSHILYLTCL